MSIDELLKELGTREIQLRRSGDELVLLGNQQALDSSLIAELRAHKSALLALIGGDNDVMWSPPVSITPEMLPLVRLTPEEIERIIATVPGGVANVQDIYPLAPLQEGLLFHHLIGEQADPYLVPSFITFDNRQRLDTYVRATQEVINRHDILRTAVLWEDLPEPVQVVWRKASLPVEEIVLDPPGGDPVKQLKAHFESRRFWIDVRRAPLLRVYIAHDQATGRWLMMHLIHHLAGDLLTMEAMWEEIEAYLLGEADRLPPARPFRNLVGQARLGTTLADHEAFFRRMLGDVDEPTAPFGLTNVRGDGSGIGEATMAVDTGLARRIRERSRRLGVSPASLFHLAWAQVLARTCGRDDVVFGTVLFGRMQGSTGSGRLMGPAINTLPVRITVGDEGAEACVRRIHFQLAELIQHEHAPLGLAQRCSAVPPPAPLFSALLNFRHIASKTRAGSEQKRQAWEGIQYLFTEERTNFPLTLSVNDQGDEFILIAQVASIDPSTICEFVHTALESLTRALESEPGTPVRALEVLSEREKHRLLVEWNDTKVSYRADVSVHELFEAQAKKTPNAIAVQYEGSQLSFGELSERANRLAGELQNLGVGPNVLVGIFVERSLEMLVGLLGILKAGGAYVPLDPAYPGDRLAFMVEDCRPRVLLTQKKLRNRLPPHQSRVVCLDGLAAEKSGYPNHRPLLDDSCKPGDLAYVLYTSGSTGKPKGVRIPHRALVNFLCAMQREPGIHSGDTLLAVTTLSFDIAALELFLPLTSGSRLVIADRETAADGARLAALLNNSGATVMQATPATWRLLLAAGWQGSPALKILCGGEAWSTELADELLPRCQSLWNMYGPTETTVWSSVARVEAGQAVTIGLPIANTTFYVLDGHRQPVPVGVPGELYIGGDGVAEGYLNRPEMTAERFIRDPFAVGAGAKLYRTGDVVRRLQDGQMEFLHRIDQQVKIRGFRIELEEVQAALKQHPSVAQCVVVVREDVPGDKRLIAYVVPFEQSEAPRSAQLREFLKQKLPVYMIPAGFVTLDEMPLTPNGKIDRKALPAPDRSPAEISSEQRVEPRTEVESRLLKIWEQVLRSKISSVRDDFFDLGGHSLLAVQLFAQIEKVFQVRLPLAALYEAPSIEGIARVLSREVISSRWPSLVPIKPSGTKTPFFCFHGGGGNVLIYRKLAHYLGPDQPFYGLQSQGLDGNSLPLRTIEDMAALYLKEIRGVQPHGPYLLGGYCLGGTIAYEAAQQLYAAGEEVALLALFDTTNWHRVALTRWDRRFLHLQRLIFHGAIVMKSDLGGKRKFLAGKLHDLRNRIPVWQGLLLAKLGRRRAPGQLQGSLLLAQVWEANHRASSRYIPKPYPGVVTDFRPARQYRVLDKPELKWDRLARGGQRVFIVPGYPAAMLLEPYVKDLAEMLTKSFDDATGQKQSSLSERVVESVQAPTV